ncbi:MAG: hypothetical protein JJE22_19730 [Bacteroidia bacterium]|nr:hypothetical protein [Bacteroidia bacterium]
MPENKKQHGDPYPKHADIRYSQRVKGKITWAILFGVFGLLISYFAAGPEYIIISVATVAAAIIGYFIGKKMEKKE